MLTTSPPQISSSGRTEHASPAFDELAHAVRTFATAEGVTLSPIATVWALRLSENIPYHRGRNRGLSIAVAVSGRKSVSLGDSEIVNDRGHVIAFHGDTAYSAVVEGSSAEPYLALKLQLPPDLIAQTLVRLAETDADVPRAANNTVISCEPLDDALAGPLLRLMASFQDPADCHLLAPLCLQEICYRILRSDAFSVLRTLVSATDERLVKALRYIETHAERPDLTVAEIASEVAMSPSHFAHGFTALFAQAPLQYRKQIRLDRARQHLLMSDTSVARAAEIAGYASTSHFTREFKSAFGMAPRQYADALNKPVKHDT
ncbi:AraC family transcriptional regulator [Roseibium sp. LAB1]